MAYSYLHSDRNYWKNKSDREQVASSVKDPFPHIIDISMYLLLHVDMWKIIKKISIAILSDRSVLLLRLMTSRDGTLD